MTADLRERLAIPSARLDDLNAFLLDPDSRVVNDVLAVIARYGTPEEINARARQAGELPALLDRVKAAHPAVPRRPGVARRGARPGRLRQRGRLPPGRARRPGGQARPSGTTWR